MLRCFQVVRRYIFGFAYTCKAPHWKRNPRIRILRSVETSATLGCGWVETGQVGVRGKKVSAVALFIHFNVVTVLSIQNFNCNVNFKHCIIFSTLL